MNTQPIFGIDVGGVLIERGSDAGDTSFFSNNFLRTHAVTGSFNAIKELALGGFGIHLVSKCGKTTEERTLAWLSHHNFYETIGVPPENVHFCRKRQDKAHICKALSITHFVDDRLEVLSYLATVPNLYLLNSQPDEVAKFRHALPRVTVVDSWQDLAAKVKVNESRWHMLS